MSELAFNLAGEHFEVPSAAVGWRVRRLKPKGAPEVVYGRDGIPLILPIEAEMEDLRHEARLEGRYRLDPLDDQNRMIPNVPAGYVYLHPAEQVAAPAPPPTSAPVPQGPDHAVIEAMRMNTELARTIIERFPAMLDSAAGLLRAADGAGMPARAPHVLPEPAEQDDEPETDETEEVAPKPSGWAGILETLIPLVAPAIMSAITSGKVQLPGGIAAMFGGRPASPKASAASAARAAGARTSSTPGAAPAPTPSGPTPARHATSSARASVPRDVAPTAGEATRTPASDPREATRTPASDPRDAAPREAAQAAGNAPDAEHAAAPELANAPGATTEITAELPTLDMAALAHFAAIQGALTFREGMLARALAAELSPAEVRTWFAELQTLSVPEAVAKIRAVLGTHGNDNTSGGAS